LCICSPRYPACYAHAPYCHIWLAPLYKICPHYLTNSTILEKKEKSYLTYELFRFSLKYLCGTFFILRRSKRDMVKNVPWSSSKLLVILVRFQSNLNFLDTFLKKTQIPNFMKIRPVGAELFQAVRRKDRHDEAKSCFS